MEKEIESKDKEIDDLKKKLEFLKSQIVNKNNKLFEQYTKVEIENAMPWSKLLPEDLKIQSI